MAAPRSPDFEYAPVPSSTATQEQGKSNTEAKHVLVNTNSVTPSLTEKNGESVTQRPGWTSTYLQNKTLLGFAIAFLCLLLAVIALAVVDAKQDGIANAKSSEHYLWTYGPTAVLVIVAALWNQVEHKIKIAMPWVILQQGTTPASKTLFMDYVTPGRPEALWTSLRKLHWPVAIAITNSLLITLLTVASTGLLSLQSTPFVRHNCRLNVTDDFVTTFDPATIGSPPVLATLAIQNGTIPFPPGTSRYGAFQHLVPPSSLQTFADLEVESLSRSFHAGLDCEIATVKSGPSGCSDRQCRSANVTIDITSPTCSIKGYNLTASCGRGLQAVSCGFNYTWGTSCDGYIDGHDKNRLVFLFAELDQDLGGASSNKTEAITVVAGNTTAIVCEARYNITNTKIVMDRNGNLKDTSHKTATMNPTQQFPAWDLVDGLLTACDAGGASIGRIYAYWSAGISPWSSLHIFFSKWVQATYPSSDLKDPSVLQSHANEMFAMVTAQMAKQSLMRPSVDISIGTCRGVEDRLRVRGLSLYLMATVLVVMIMLTIGLMCVAPRRYASRDPSSIGGMALVLSQSTALLSRLSASALTDLKSMENDMVNIDCHTVSYQAGPDWRFEVDLNASETVEDLDDDMDETPSSEITYWRPLSLRPVFKISIIIVLIILVVVLEVLYSVSKKNDGLAEVDPQRYQRFAWVYVPAIVMLTAQTLVGMIAFSSLMIFPYFRLRQASTNTHDHILRNYVSETAIKSLWQSVFAKDIVVVCMALALLLTPLLTIAVSGLYTAQATSKSIPISLSIQDQLNSTFLSKDVQESMNPIWITSSNAIGLLLSQNFTFPKWTYDELAFPEAQLQLPTTINSSILSGSNVTVRLPGIRSDLGCKLASSVPTNFTDTVGGFYQRKMNVTAYEALGLYDDTGSNWPSPGSSPFGFFEACDGFKFGDRGNTFCGAMGTSEMNWNAFTCSSIINQLDVEVTMDASSLTILSATPDESTVRFFSNQTLAPGTMDAFPSSMIPSLFGSSNFNEKFSVAGYYDPAFQAVVYGLGTRDDLKSFPMKEYLSTEGFDKVFAELQHVHRTMTAQSANLIRMPLNTTSPLAPPSTVSATLVNSHVYRLHQSAISTRILDGLLIATALCIALSFFLMNTSKTLPKNPASIAASASLLSSDAKMFQEGVLPKGAQWCNDTELKAQKVWDGVLFRLGWWNSDGQSEREELGGYFKIDSI
ncbi:hypothetical protein B5807_04380 [Epicoccum nigrum]|uniref:Uncharacterized protein n=1 Tax=Epicoccum nigrum TaxID=105696 RepID=A0A1Y2M3H5_EPING|nr:hypothetical protein B5807_04380 [Epicoccum nigrum]